MSYNSRYFVDKNNRAETAKKHTKEMEDKYSADIKNAVSKTVIYDDKNVSLSSCVATPTSIVVDTDSVSAVFDYANGKTAVLNFASYKNPGGMFIEGSKAQEECLCHESFLYNVLKEKTDYYEFNNNHKNRALYLNRALYSPDILFIRNGKEIKADVITCASPNRAAFIKYNTKPEDEELNLNVLRGRIEFIKNIAETQNVETLILGAFGCGVFRQDAKVVATTFKEVFAKTSVKKIVYAVLSSGDKYNYEQFEKIFA